MFVSVISILFIASSALAGYADSSSSNSDQGQGYGYAGSFSGNAQSPDFIQTQTDFTNFLNGYLDSLQKYHQKFINQGGGNTIPYSYSSTMSNENSNSNAQSSLTIIPRMSQGQRGGANYGGGFGNSGAGAFSGGFSGVPDFNGFTFGAIPNFATTNFGPGSGAASAGASIGPQGIHQTAALYPENPNSPNIDNRFSETGAGGGGGHYSVFTSSSSQSSNINGKPQSSHQATTTVNDNGKVSTFTVKNP